MQDCLITVPPSSSLKFEKAGSHERWLWNNFSNCYGYTIRHAWIRAVNLGSLTLSQDNKGDNNKLTSSEGLQELLDRDGWGWIDPNDINPATMHVVGVFGFRPLGYDFNEHHCFSLNKDGSFSEKPGSGNALIRSGRYSDHHHPLTIENLIDEYTKDIAKSVMSPVFSGFHRILDNGLKIHARHFRQGAPELMHFYPSYS